MGEKLSKILPSNKGKSKISDILAPSEGIFTKVWETLRYKPCS